MLALLVAVEVAGWSAGAVRAPSSPQAWGGERADKGPEDVADYNLEAALDPQTHVVEGKERLIWRNRSAVPISALYIHMYLNAFENPESTFGREVQRYGGERSEIRLHEGEYGYIALLDVSQGGVPVPWQFVHPDGGPDTDHTVARLDLPKPVPPGGKAQVDFAFRSQLPRVVARSGYFDRFHLVAQWYPKVGVLELPGERGAVQPRWNCHEYHEFSEFYADFGSYRAEITVPKGYVFGSTGREIRPPDEVPQGVRHLIAQDRVHDFAWTAWDGYAPPLTGKWHDVDVKVLYPPEYAEAGRISLQATLDALEYFSTTLGPYPHKQVTVVVPPFNAWEAGGMEYETFFTSLGAKDPPELALVRFVAIHEFGHGYFMGLLASNEFEEPFLDEGLNEFWDGRMLRDEPLRLGLPGLAGRLLPSIDLRTFDAMRTGTQRFQADPIAGSSWARWSTGSYGLVYARTALVFHDLEEMLGGEVLARGFREYYRRWHDRHPSTADFEQALADAAGDKAPLVRQWFVEQVYDRAPVDDRVEQVEAKEILPEAGLAPDHVERKPAEVEREIRERREQFRKEHPGAKPSEPGPFPWRSTVDVRRYAAHVPEQVKIVFEDGSSQTMAFPVEDRWRHYVFERAVKVKSARLDPGRSVLLDLDKLDDGRTRERDGTASGRWTLEFKAWAELGLSLLESL
ncbi:MAG TPA: M1 family metallopeptidase [Myxococcales bacterium]|nr:M1 family metallopeptidase [Myxococcales bacterium]